MTAKQTLKDSFDQALCRSTDISHMNTYKLWFHHTFITDIGTTQRCSTVETDPSINASAPMMNIVRIVACLRPSLLWWRWFCKNVYCCCREKQISGSAYPTPACLFQLYHTEGKRARQDTSSSKQHRTRLNLIWDVSVQSWQSEEQHKRHQGRGHKKTSHARDSDTSKLEQLPRGRRQQSSRPSARMVVGTTRSSKSYHIFWNCQHI